ncbi:hypothetical protein MRB53_015448 [Persea americana]|uniref:Uncharacterized protein n=1 Tax=Persea americana TaxID=3435 RepID=A0ACC2KE57_PERAE|nr:hypothetical protein MRB53_015448 [Persea americana]
MPRETREARGEGCAALCSAAGALRRETEGSREMGIVDSLRWVVMERMVGERGMGHSDEGWRRDGRMLGAGRDGDGDRWLALRALRGREMQRM